jgi:hypothetical protein
MFVHRAPLSGSPFDIEVDSISPAEWDQALSDFDDGHYEQAACTGGGKNASHLVLRENGKVIAGAQVAIYALPGLGRGLALVRFGPFWRRHGQPVSPDIYQAAISALVAEYCERRGHCLVVRPRPNPEFFAVESQMLSDLGFVVRRSLPAPARYCADVSLDENAQLANFDQKWRYNLRQAQKNNFDIRLCDTAAEVAVFRQVHEDMTARKSLDSAARGMIDSLEGLTRLPDAIRMRVILVRHEDRPIAGATVGIVGDTAFYVLGATNHMALKLKAGYAMQWWIMRWLSTQNIRWYELGGTGDPGIRQFKKGLIGKRGVVLETGEYDKWTENSARIATDIVYRLRDARDFVGRWVG